MDSQTVWNTSLHTFIKSSSCSWPRAARWTPSLVEAVYVAAAGGRHSSLKRRLKRVHKLFMSVIIWHQPAHELREVQEHLLRGPRREDGRGPSRWFIGRVDKSPAREVKLDDRSRRVDVTGNTFSASFLKTLHFNLHSSLTFARRHLSIRQVRRSGRFSVCLKICSHEARVSHFVHLEKTLASQDG